MKFGLIPPEPPRRSDLSACAPQFAARVADVLSSMKAQGFDPVVYEALRTEDRQRWLYGFGRQYDDDRGIVTHVDDPRTGWHFFGLATDIISAAHGWDNSRFFDALADAYEAHGLTAGGRWKMADRPHGQWGHCRTTPSDESSTLYAHGGLPAVWAAVGAG